MDLSFSPLYLTSKLILHPRHARLLVIGLRVFWVLFILSFAFFEVWMPASAAVTISSLIAEAGDGQVLIKWSTATELNSSGFFVLRSTTQNDGYQRISNFIPSTGDQVAGASYQYLDQDVVNGVTYYYKLEAIDTSNHSDFFGPISAVPGVATQTPTITPTIDPSISPTITNTPGPTSTPTQTPTITRTATPPLTSTPIPIATSIPETLITTTPTATLTSTPTWIPFPTVTLIYPTATSTITLPDTPVPLVTDLSAGSESNGQSNLLRSGLIVSIVLLWVLLGGWLYIFLYRGRF